MRSSPDSTPVCSPDSLGPSGGSLDSFGPIPIGLGAATDLFCAAKAAEGASPRTVEWYRMIVGRAVRRIGEARPVDAIPAAEKVFGKASGGFAVDPRLALTLGWRLTH